MPFAAKMVTFSARNTSIQILEGELKIETIHDKVILIYSTLALKNSSSYQFIFTFHQVVVRGSSQIVTTTLTGGYRYSLTVYVDYTAEAVVQTNRVTSWLAYQ